VGDTAKAKAEDKTASTKRVVTLRELGPQLPLGVLDSANLYHKGVENRAWKLSTERELGELRDRNRDSNFAQYVSMILGTMCTKLGPHDFDGKKIEDKQILVSQMFMADVLYAYIWLRVDALGPNLNMNIKCPACEQEFPFTADLNTLEVTCADKVEDTQWPFKLKHPIDIRGKKAVALKLGPTRWNAMESSKANQFNMGQMKADIVRYSIHGVSHDGEAFEAIPVGEHELDELSKFDFERKFFRFFFPLIKTEDLLEEVFALLYCIKGMTWEACENMRTKDRIWMLRRLEKQLKREAEDAKRASGGK
jgi:hypothetical protein